MAISNNDKFVVSASVDKSLKVFDLEAELQIHHFADIHLGNSPILPGILIYLLDSVNSVAISDDNNLMISGSSDKSIKIFDLTTMQMIYHIKDAHSGINQPLLYFE